MKNRLQSFVPVAVAGVFAVAAMAVFPSSAIASGSETTWTAGGGATLSFADSRAAAWTAGTNVVVSGFAESAIRFGTSEVGLTSAQRRRFVTSDGKKLYVNSDGYLTTQPRGSVLIFN